MASGLLSFIGGAARGATNIADEERTKRVRQQEMFGQLALKSISEFQSEIQTVSREHTQLNDLGKQMKRNGVAPEIIDHVLSMPYAEAVKLANDPMKLKNISVKPKEPVAPAQPAAAAPQAAPAQATQTPQPGGMAPPAAAVMPPPQPGAAPAAGPAMPAMGQPMPAQAPAGQPAQQFRDGSTNLFESRRRSILELAQNAGWDKGAIQRFQQAMDSGANLGIYKFANPETAGQLIFTDPKQAEQRIEANKMAMTSMLKVASELDPNMKPQEKVKVLTNAMQQAYAGANGGSTEGLMMPSDTMFSNLMNPQFAARKLQIETEKAERDNKIISLKNVLMQRNPKLTPEQAQIEAEGIAAGATQRPEGTGDIPSYQTAMKDVAAAVGRNYSGEMFPDRDGTFRMKLTDETLRPELQFATRIAETNFQNSVKKAGGLLNAMTPAMAASEAAKVVDLVKEAWALQLKNANGKPEAALDRIKSEMGTINAKTEKTEADQKRLFILEGIQELYKYQKTPEASTSTRRGRAPGTR